MKAHSSNEGVSDLLETTGLGVNRVLGTVLLAGTLLAQTTGVSLLIVLIDCGTLVSCVTTLAKH